MTQEKLKLVLDALENGDVPTPENVGKNLDAITAIKEALAHRHEWFRTSEMKVGQMRCISCGTWGHEEMPQRTWVGLTDEEIQECLKGLPTQTIDVYARRIEAKLKEKNGA